MGESKYVIKLFLSLKIEKLSIQYSDVITAKEKLKGWGCWLNIIEVMCGRYNPTLPAYYYNILTCSSRGKRLDRESGEWCCYELFLGKMKQEP